MFSLQDLALSNLTPFDAEQIRRIAEQLPLMAELTGADVFIDCFTTDGRAVVVAQERPQSAASAYRKDIVGEYALAENEPAVFHVHDMGAPMRDLKAITQENHTVRQDVIPILNPENRCIAVLIQEKDISSDLLQEKKFQSLASSYEAEDRSLRADDGDYEDMTLREVHHRVKNNLQLVASILNLQSRRCADEFTKKILQENVGRVLSIAAIHDILTKSGSNFREIDSLALLEQLRKNLAVFIPEGKKITIQVSGEHAMLSSSTASAVALVVNELVTNALEHAFEDRGGGNISIDFFAGTLFNTITVADDGVGFDVGKRSGNTLGLNIVDATVRDRLRGQLRIHSDESGTRAAFDFKTK